MVEVKDSSNKDKRDPEEIEVMRIEPERKRLTLEIISPRANSYIEFPSPTILNPWPNLILRDDIKDWYPTIGLTSLPCGEHESRTSPRDDESPFAPRIYSPLPNERTSSFGNSVFTFSEGKGI